MAGPKPIWIRRSCLLLTALFSLLLWHLCDSAVARPSSKAISDHEASKVQKASAEGTRLFKKKEYSNALESFEQTYRLHPHYSIQCNIARCYEQLTDMVQAREHYWRCFREGAQNSKMRAGVEEAIIQVESRITWVMVQSPGKGGMVYADGISLGKAPLRVPLNPGSRVLEVRREGATPAMTTLTTQGGEMQTLELIPVDIVSVKTKSQAGSSSQRQLKNTLSTSTASPPLPPPSSPRNGLRPLWFWTTAALTVALLTTASIVGAQALSLKNDYENNPTRDGYNQTKDRRLWANLFWGATLIAAGSSATLFFFTDFNKKQNTDRHGLSFNLGVKGTF